MKNKALIIVGIAIAIGGCSKDSSTMPSNKKSNLVSIAGTYAGQTHYSEYDVLNSGPTHSVYSADTIFRDTINVIDMPGDSVFVVQFKHYDSKDLRYGYNVTDTFKYDSSNVYYKHYNDVCNDTFTKPDTDSLHSMYQYYDGGINGFYISHTNEFKGKKL